MQRFSSAAIRRRAAAITAGLVAVALAPIATAAPLTSAAVGSGDGGDVEVVVVDAADRDGIRTADRLDEGRTYVLTVSGSYAYDAKGTRADAECSQGVGDPSFQPGRYGTGSSDLLDLTINGVYFDWAPASGGAPGSCDPSGTYRLELTPTGPGRLLFAISDTGHNDNTGALQVTVAARRCDASAPAACVPLPCDPVGDPMGCGPGVSCDPAGDPSACLPAPPCDPASDPAGCLSNPPCDPATDPAACLPRPGCTVDPQSCVPVAAGASTQLTEVLVVGASDADGTTTQQPLVPGRPYTFVVSGTWRDANGFEADAECSRAPSEPGPIADRTPGDPSDPYDLTINGALFTWVPVEGGESPCSDSATYRLDVPWGAPAKATFAVSGGSDGAMGVLEVAIYAAGATQGVAVPNPGPAVPVAGQVVEQLLIDSRHTVGAATAHPLLAGRHYEIRVEGAYAYAPGGWTADAECADVGPGTPAADDRYSNELLDLKINSADIAWVPVERTPANADLACSPSHTYTFRHRWGTTGHAWFRVDDLGLISHADNAGVLLVTITALG